MRSIVITSIVAALLGGGGVYLWRYYGGLEGEQAQAIAFIDTYGDYAEVAEQVEMSVHLPGVEGNADRAELFTLLSSILTEQMAPARREELARIAFSNLDALKKETDAAQAAQATLYKTLQDLDNASRVFRSIDLQKRAAGIVSVARKRAETSARITSILTEINNHTYAIITHILEDKGELTQEHIITINNATTMAEERHDVLEGLYDELIRHKKDLDRMFRDFAAAAI